jgi:hypothetical protein
MNFIGKFLSRFHTFEDQHPQVKLAVEVGAAVASHFHGGGTLGALEAVIEGLSEAIAAHKAEVPTPVEAPSAPAS